MTGVPGEEVLQQLKRMADDMVELLSRRTGPHLHDTLGDLAEEVRVRRQRLGNADERGQLEIEKAGQGLRTSEHRWESPPDLHAVDRSDRPVANISRRAPDVDRAETPHHLRELLTGESANLKEAFRWMEETPGLPFRWKLQDARRTSSSFRDRKGVTVEGWVFDGRRKIGHTYTAFVMKRGKIEAQVREVKLYDHYEDKEYQGKGFLKAFDRVLDDPRLSQVDSIHVYGQLPNGGRPWVGVGYDWDRGHEAFPTHIATMADHVRRMLEQPLAPSDHKLLSGLLTELEGSPAGVRSAQAIYAMKDSRGMPIGRELLQNTPFHGTRKPRLTALSSAQDATMGAEKAADRDFGVRGTDSRSGMTADPNEYYGTPHAGPPPEAGNAIGEPSSPENSTNDSKGSGSTGGPTIGDIINPKNSFDQ